MEPLLSISGELVVFTTSREPKSGTETNLKPTLDSSGLEKRRRKILLLTK
jgi:hypothetical protein